MLQAILFDFNGVLLDDEHVHFELFQRVAREESYDLSQGEYDEEIVALDDAAGFRAIFAKHGAELDQDALTELIARKARYYEQWMSEQGFPFFPGAVETVRSARAAGIRLCVVSGALRSEIEGALEQEQLLQDFEHIVAAEDVSESKPSSEGYLAGLAALGIEAGCAAAVEDTIEGLQSARGAGLFTVGVAQTLAAEHLEADWIVPDIERLEIEQLASRFSVRRGGLD